MLNLIRKLNANPIASAELNHQWHVIEKSRSGRMWIGIAILLLVPALLSSLVFYVLALLGQPLPLPLIFDQIDTVPEILATVAQMTLVTMNLAHYLVLMLVSFALATNSIMREKRGKTWENLLLTNVSARQIVVGKTWASLHALYGDQIIIGILRLGFVAYLLTTFSPFQFQGLTVTPGHVLVISLFVIGFTLIDAVMNVVLGLLAALLAVPGVVGLSIFGSLRVVATWYGVWWIVNTVNVMMYQPGLLFLLVGVGGLIFYAFLTWIALLGAELAAVTGSNASPRGAKA